MLKRKDSHWLAGFCLLFFLLILPGCGSNTSTRSSSATPASTPELKGPGAANLTATALATPTLVRCPGIQASPASTHGWDLYRDTHFPFTFLIPPEWKAGSFVDANDDYIVQVSPSGGSSPVGQPVLAAPEHVSIAVAPPGSAGGYADDPNWAAEANAITISGIETKIYDRTSPDCEEINRGVTATFDQRLFTFFLATVPEKARDDIMLFLGILRSFYYA